MVNLFTLFDYNIAFFKIRLCNLCVNICYLFIVNRNTALLNKSSSLTVLRNESALLHEVKNSDFTVYKINHGVGHGVCAGQAGPGEGGAQK